MPALRGEEDRCQVWNWTYRSGRGAEIRVCGKIFSVKKWCRRTQTPKEPKVKNQAISEPDENKYLNLPPATYPPHILVRHFLPSFLLSSHILVLNSTIFSCAIKNKYLSIGILWIAFVNGMARNEGWVRGGEEPVTVQQAKESVKINAGPSHVFFLLCFRWEMADAGVGVYTGMSNNCAFFALVYVQWWPNEMQLIKFEISQQLMLQFEWNKV